MSRIFWIRFNVSGSSVCFDVALLEANAEAEAAAAAAETDGDEAIIFVVFGIETGGAVLVIVMPPLAVIGLTLIGDPAVEPLPAAAITVACCWGLLRCTNVVFLVGDCVDVAGAKMT